MKINVKELVSISPKRDNTQAIILEEVAAQFMSSSHPVSNKNAF